MKPDTKNSETKISLLENFLEKYGDEYDTIDYIALERANLSEMYETVQQAKDGGCPRWDIAEFFLLQLKTAIELETIEWLTEWSDETEDAEYIYFVRRDILQNWPEMDYPPIPGKVAEYLKHCERLTTKEPPHQPQATKRRKTSYHPDEVPPVSVYMTLGLLLADLKYFEKYDEQGRKGGKAATINHIQELVEAFHVTDKGLSKNNLQRIINTALDVLNSSFLPDKRQK